MQTTFKSLESREKVFYIGTFVFLIVSFAFYQSEGGLNYKTGQGLSYLFSLLSFVYFCYYVYFKYKTKNKTPVGVA